MCESEESGTDSANDDNDDSVHELLKQLCRSMAKAENILEERNICKLKSKCIEILKNFQFPNKDSIDINFDHILKLDARMFAAKLIFKKNPLKLQNIKDIETTLESIDKVDYFVNGPGKDVVKFLLLLENEYKYAKSQPSMLVPAPFTLFGDFKDNKHYPEAALKCSYNLKPRFFRGVEKITSANNPYMPKLIASYIQNKMSLQLSNYNAEVSGEKPTLQTLDMTNREYGLKFKDFDVLNNFKDKEIIGNEAVKACKLPILTETICKLGPITEDIYDILARISESFSDVGVSKEKFVKVLLDLKCLRNEYIRNSCVANSVPLPQFLNNVKLLIVGKQSDIFKLNDVHVFDMVADVTTENLLPGTIHSYIEPFLESGTAYRRLEAIYLAKNEFHGFLFKAFSVALDEYLMAFRHLVFSVEDQSLLSFQNRMRYITKYIVRFTNALIMKPSKSPPMGQKLLSFFCNELGRHTDVNFNAILIFFIRRLCHVYFNQLEKWIFKGVLDDTFNELFIRDITHFKFQTKYYYNRVYYVNPNSVPDFLQNYENLILQCGKYSNLLRTYKPTHPLFSINYPALNVSLSYAEIQNLRSNCQKYYTTLLEVCGEPVSLKKKICKCKELVKQRFVEDRVHHLEKEALSEQAVEEKHVDLLPVVKENQLNKNLKDIITAVTDSNENSVTCSATYIPITDIERNQFSTIETQELNELKFAADDDLIDLYCNRKSCFKYNKAPFSNDNKFDEEFLHKSLKIQPYELHIVPKMQCEDEMQTPTSSTTVAIFNKSATEVIVKCKEEKLDEESENPSPQKTYLELLEEKIAAQELGSNVYKETNKITEATFNSSGLMVKPECGFTMASGTSKQELTINIDDSFMNNETDINDLLTPGYKDCYQYCNELLRSNFRCYYKDSYQYPNERLRSNLRRTSRKLRKENTADTLDVVRLKDFLQKSVTMPLNAYYECVSNEVMRLFIDELELLAHIKSLGHYFLLMDGDFCFNITHDLFTKLEDGIKPEHLFNHRTLNNILNKALAPKWTGSYERGKSLSFIVRNIPEKFDLNSLGVFCDLTMSYKVNWPLNYIINQEILDKYEHIFKVLLKIKRISWLFMNSFQILKASIIKHGKPLLNSPQFSHVQKIIFKFSKFIQKLQKYISLTVLKGSSKVFKNDLIYSNCIEDIHRAHTAFVKRVMDHALIEGGSLEFQDRLKQIFEILLRFYYNLKACQFKLLPDDEHFTHSRYKKLIIDELEFEESLQLIINLCQEISSQEAHHQNMDKFIKVFTF
ncbi:uncharacterized protein LOC119690050 [Teleopsis dalmanni]|uniref:uncharacterized protein LOC119690050 n=1 Tax=Teleopsis dalmanni TaxID=139649 RepID=UPI0018CCE7C1|nr:uncharacterized protein LOC119690050 [Teleopsis dalmanni]